MTDANRPAGLPEGFTEEQVAETLDAIPIIDGGGHPLPQVMEALGTLPAGKYYALIAPFEPSPLIGKARAAGFNACIDKQAENRFRVLFWRD